VAAKRFEELMELLNRKPSHSLTLLICVSFVIVASLISLLCHAVTAKKRVRS
jgi:hypothetical protein